MDIAPSLFNGIGVVGLFGLMFWMLATSRLYTRAQVDVYLKRIDALESTNAMLLAQNSELMETTRLGRVTWDALRRGAES